MAQLDRSRKLTKYASTAAYYLLFAGAFFLVARYVAGHLDVIAELKSFGLTFWLVVSAVYVGTLLSKAWSFDILAAVFGARVPVKVSVALAASGLLGNYLLPGNTSIPLRSLYLKRVHGLEYTAFVPIALAAFVLATGLYGIATGFAAIAIGPVGSESYPKIIQIMAVGGAVLIALLLLPLPLEKLPYVGKFAAKALYGWRQLVSNRRLFGLWLLNEALRASLEVAYFFLIARELGVPISLAQAIVITLVKECSIFLRVTPGAFGVAEGVQAYFAYAFGLDVARVLLAGLVGRLIEIVWLFLLAALLSRHVKISNANSGGNSASPQVDRI